MIFWWIFGGETGLPVLFLRHLECWVLNQLFHSPLSPSLRCFFSSSSLPAIRVVPSAYLRLLIFLPTIVIPSCDLSSPAFCMMYSTYKLNKQGDNIQAWCTPFTIWNQSVVLCPVLPVASWPAYRFLRRQVRLSDILISLRIFQVGRCPICYWRSVEK